MVYLGNLFEVPVLTIWKLYMVHKDTVDWSPFNSLSSYYEVELYERGEPNTSNEFKSKIGIFLQ